jgi:hypothetical protein
LRQYIIKGRHRSKYKTNLVPKFIIAEMCVKSFGPDQLFGHPTQVLDPFLHNQVWNSYEAQNFLLSISVKTAGA